MIDIELAFETRSAEQFGIIIITGIKYHRTKNFDPIYKTWASLRKRINEQLGIDVIGLFVYDDVQERLSCNFSLNSLCSDEKSKEIFRKNFKNHIATRFNNVVIILLARMRYDDKYRNMLKSGATEEEFIDYLNQFLKELGLRTEDDENRAKVKKAKLEQAKQAIKKKILPGA